MQRRGKKMKVEIDRSRIMTCIAHHGSTMLTKFAYAWASLNYPIGADVTITEPHFLISLATTRNRLIEKAIDNDFTHIFFMDSDNPPPPDALIKLYEHNLDCVSGLYFARRTGLVDNLPLPIMYKRLKPRFDYSDACMRHIEDFNYGELIKADIVGMGCLLIKTDVLKKISERNYSEEYKWCEISTPLSTEDLALCDRIYDVDTEIYVDTSIIVPHLGFSGTDIQDYAELKYVKMIRWGFQDCADANSDTFIQDVCKFSFDDHINDKTDDIRQSLQNVAEFNESVKIKR